MRAGGLAYKTGNWDENSPYEWWVRNTIWPWEAKNSKTWSTTDWINIYVTQYQNEFAFFDYVNNQKSGDFMVMDLRGPTDGTPPDGIPDHARVFVGYDITSTDQNDYLSAQGNYLTIPPAEFTWLTNQHCVDRRHVAYDYNLFANNPVWYWHVIP